jgi:hypothetical protein
MAEKVVKKYAIDERWLKADGEIYPDATSVVGPEKDGHDPVLWAKVDAKFHEKVISGALIASVGEVEATAKIEENGKKVEKVAIGSYIRLEATDPQAALLLMDGRMVETVVDGKKKPGVLTKFNYGYDLDARGVMRNPLLQKLEGPEKAIERAVKALAAVPGWDEARARAAVMANPAAFATA